MSISENIRALAGEGLAVAEIARRLGIRHQHAYNVLKTKSVPAVTARAVKGKASPDKFGNVLFVIYDVGMIRDTDRFTAEFNDRDDVLIAIVKH